MTNAHRSFAPFLGIVLALATLAPGAPAAAKRPAPAPSDTTMVPIPAGEFVMGREGTGDSSPPHTVRLGAFLLDRHEVTNAEYEAFCKATERKLPIFWGVDKFRCGPRYPQRPVIGVSWSDAQDYAKWRGKRLPTEAEWEFAARGGLAGKRYVDGDLLDSSRVNFTRSQQEGPADVGSYPPNGYGLYDMAGNVQEWVADRFDTEYYKNSPGDDPRGPEKGRFRVIRGGGWFTGPMCMDVDKRYALPANWVDFNVGFRCARGGQPAAARSEGGQTMSEKERPEIGSIGWVDLTVPDAPRLRDFYVAVAGWKAEEVPMGDYSDYGMAAPGSGRSVAGVCHARGENAGLPAQWLVYITVADLDASLERCRSLGGALVSGPRDLGAYGRFAVIRDPAGAVAGLIQPPK